MSEIQLHDDLQSRMNRINFEYDMNTELTESVNRQRIITDYGSGIWSGSFSIGTLGSGDELLKRSLYSFILQMKNPSNYSNLNFGLFSNQIGGINIDETRVSVNRNGQIVPSGGATLTTIQPNSYALIRKNGESIYRLIYIIGTNTNGTQFNFYLPDRTVSGSGTYFLKRPDEFRFALDQQTIQRQYTFSPGVDGPFTFGIEEKKQ